MRVSLATKRPGVAGFTLIEALVALALTGLVLSALANITSQWLPNWNRGMDRIQRSEAIGLALQRIGADLAAAEYVPANREQRQPLFDGSELSVMFVRTTLGPNAKTGLDVVRIGETTDQRDLVTVRSSAPFGPLPQGTSLSEQIQFGDPVVLLRVPFRLSFSYAGRDLAWKSSWHDADRLPAAIRLTVRDATTERVLSVSTVASIHADAPAVNCAPPGKDCNGKSDGAEKNPTDASTDSSNSANVASQQGPPR
ncbi:MAG TPA: prepilin-type N-terminal cleavage/methylation domain-containing protein [Bradyrhizobium sp.]|nr:prepilin-type N-terminal cleavage/methylation domain-containing protein [Bradyrhizobium sp.]